MTDNRSGSGVADLCVVIPALDEEARIGQTLSALAAQRYRDFDVVVVDNMSTDRTVQRVREFSAAHPDMSVEVVEEPEKGTGAAADTGMRFAAARGATRLARTDADCLPDPNWTAELTAGFDAGLRMIAGRMRPRTDEGLSWSQMLGMRTMFVLGTYLGKLNPDFRGPQFHGPYILTPGCNMAITAELYEAAGGFPRTRIEDEHEDKALHGRVRTLTSEYGKRRGAVVYGSCRRIAAWGYRNTFLWYYDHRFRPEHVDIR